MKLKFMGSSHRHILKKGDDFGGRLSEGLAKEVVFSKDNSWVVDTEEVGLSEEAVEVLVGTDRFKDVTDLKAIPSNDHQRIFLGMGATDKAATEAAEDEAEDEPRGENKPEGDEPAKGTTETDATPTTTTGGSTRGGGRRGGST